MATQAPAAAKAPAATQAKAMQKASWRGVPFAVTLGEFRSGRRQALHEYPFRDDPWPEDIGRKTRRFAVTGFLVTDSLVYGGGDVVDQRERMIAAAEKKGTGELVHPTFGKLTVSLEDIAIVERWDARRYFELTFSFLEAGKRQFPTVASQTGDAVKTSAAKAADAASASFSKKITPALKAGGSPLDKALKVNATWSSKITALAKDPKKLLGLASQLPGPFGRFFNGRNLGFLGSFKNLVSTAHTVADLIRVGANARTLIRTAITTVTKAMSQIGVVSAALDVSNAVRQLMKSFSASAANPADGIRLLANLSRFSSSDAAAVTPAGAATDLLYRRMAAVSLAEASVAYQPSSADDAALARRVVTDVLDEHILQAGDAGDDDVYAALRDLRSSVVQDLQVRGASLAPIVTVRSVSPTPALVLANRLYRDASRADELVTEAQPISPLFMPTEFPALAS
ncbi:MAG: DNA circularization protein [Caulobacteraceae bacterium]